MMISVSRPAADRITQKATLIVIQMLTHSTRNSSLGPTHLRASHEPPRPRPPEALHAVIKTNDHIFTADNLLCRQARAGETRSEKHGQSRVRLLVEEATRRQHSDHNNWARLWRHDDDHNAITNDNNNNKPMALFTSLVRSLGKSVRLGRRFPSFR